MSTTPLRQSSHVKHVVALRGAWNARTAGAAVASPCLQELFLAPTCLHWLHVLVTVLVKVLMVVVVVVMLMLLRVLSSVAARRNASQQARAPHLELAMPSIRT